MVVSAACHPFGLPLRDFVAYDLQALVAAVSKLPRQTKLAGRTYSRFARGLSSAGRAPALQAGGRWFESNRPHIKRADVAQSAEQLICNQQVTGSSPVVGSTGFVLQVNHLGGFPSGQRGQTVNLLSPTSVVRIHHHPVHDGERDL